MPDYGTSSTSVMSSNLDPYGPNLPLVQVDLRILLQETMPITSYGVIQIWEVLGELFPEIVVDHRSEVAPGKAHNLKLRSTPQLDSVLLANGRLAILIHEDMVDLRWISPNLHEKATYPGYKNMLGSLQEVVKRLQYSPAELAGVNMAYTNFVVRGKNQPDTWFIRNRGIVADGDVNSSSLRLESATRFEDGIEYRVTCDSAVNLEGQEGQLFRCAAGIASAGSQWPQEMDRVHKKLVEMFEEVISEEAKQLWQR